MTPFKIEGVDYSPEGIERLRQDIIEWRDNAMTQGVWQAVAILSHAIALLAYLKELVERDVAAGNSTPVAETAVAEQQ